MTIDPVERSRLLRLATHASVATAGCLILLKLAAYVATGSVSVLASLVDSLMDAGASLLNLLAVRYASTPPDTEHRFGHGKAESLAGLGQATFIAGSGCFLCIEAVARLLKPQPPEQTGLGIAVMLASIVATLLLLAIQRHVVSRTDSNAIRADALHYRADLLSNTAIIVALLLSQRGWPGFDALLALGIAGYILHAAWRIFRRALDELLDRELPPEERNKIMALCHDHPEVRGVHDLRTRISGGTVFIQLHLELDAALDLRGAHAISDAVHSALAGAYAGADIVIHQDPV